MLAGFGDASRYVPSEKAVTFTDNHDIQRHARNIRQGRCHGCNGQRNCIGQCIHFAQHALYFADGQRHTLANAFLLAHPYGYPCIMSSYNFSRSGDGPPEESERCKEGWICEHRQALLFKLVEFRRKTARAPLTDFQADGPRLAFARRGIGFFALNAGPDPWTAHLQTGLPQGVYVDAVHGKEVSVCEDGTSHVEVQSEGVTLLLKTDRTSKSPRCSPRPVQPPQARAACALHPGCAGLPGDCCPAPGGLMLACCWQTGGSPGTTQASCSSHSGCQGLPGDCCPAPGGTMLACCYDSSNIIDVA